MRTEEEIREVLAKVREIAVDYDNQPVHEIAAAKHHIDALMWVLNDLEEDNT